MATSTSIPERCDSPTRERHWEMLVIASIVIAASFLLRVESAEEVKLSEFALPPLCLSRAWFGVTCPGCGLTRSFVYLAHGEWSASWHAHRIGWILAVLVVLQIPYRIHGLCHPGKPLLSRPVRSVISYFLIALLIGNWLVGLMPLH